LRIATTGALRQYFKEHPKEFDPRKYLKASTLAMSELCKQRFQSFGSAGHASAIKPIKCETMAEYYKSGKLQAVIK
jgi:fructose-bisphosphate aldolase, class II